MNLYSRKTSIILMSVLVLIYGFLFGGCGTNNTVQSPPGAVSPTGTNVSPTSIVTVTGAPSLTTPGTTTIAGTTGSAISNLVALPGQLTTIESNADEIFANVNQGNWSKAKQQLTTIKTNFNEVNPLLKVSFIPATLVTDLSNAIASLEKNVSNNKTYESSVDANAVIYAVINISDKYKTSIPTDFSRLSYYAREIVINGMKKDWYTASSNFNKGKEVWNRIKPLMESTYKTHVSEFDALLPKVERSITDKTASYTHSDIKAIFDKIALIKSYYAKQIKT